MSRKQILFIIDTAPLPIDCGQRVRIKGLTDACRAAADVTLIAPRPARTEDVRQVESEFARVYWVDDFVVSGPARLLAMAAAFPHVSGLPTPGKLAAMAPFVRAIAAAHPAKFDLIWAERPHIAALCGRWRRKMVVDLDDLEHLKIAGQRKLATGRLERLKLDYRYHFYRRIETGWAARCFAAVVCSREDKAYLIRNGCANGFVVPNGAGLPVKPGSLPGATNAAPRLLFLANLSYGPNADAMDWLRAEIMPALLRADPTTTLDVIGPNAPRAPEGAINYRGFIDDLAGALDEYDAMVAPLRYGGGTKLKVLDAMARGLPVITTAIGAEGLGLYHGVNALLAETPAEFVAQVAHVRAEKEWAGGIAVNARDHVARTYAWPAIQGRLANWIRHVKPHEKAVAFAPLLTLGKRFLISQ
jgi:glycosyltransferase involved in cell wall biosynthesis